MWLPVLALALLIGWLIGSFPTAYLVVKRHTGLDLRVTGSTNVGANNALRSTGSKRVGVTVLLLDLLKGALAVAAGWAVAAAFGVADGFLPPTATFWPKAVALLGAILGHNFNLFLSLSAGRLSGGKGIASAAGGFLLLMPWVVVAWCVLFGIGLYGFAQWKGVKDSIPGNVLGTAGVPLVGLWLYGWPGFVVMLGFALLVLPKHVAQMRELLALPAAERHEQPVVRAS